MARAWGAEQACGALCCCEAAQRGGGAVCAGGRRFGGVGDTAGREKAAAPADEGRQPFRVAKGL